MTTPDVKEMAETLKDCREYLTGNREPEGMIGKDAPNAVAGLVWTIDTALSTQAQGEQRRMDQTPKDEVARLIRHGVLADKHTDEIAAEILKALAETRPSDSGECPPRAVFSDPLSQTPAQSDDVREALVKALEEILAHMTDPNVSTSDTYPVFGLNFPSLVLKGRAALAARQLDSPVLNKKPHHLSDLEFTELIRTWRSNGFEFAVQIVREFPAVDGKTILLALNDARSMLPTLPSKGN